MYMIVILKIINIKFIYKFLEKIYEKWILFLHAHKRVNILWKIIVLLIVNSFTFCTKFGTFKI